MKKGGFVDDMLGVVDTVTVHDANALFGQLLVQSSPEMLIHGNISEVDALKLQSIILDTIKPSAPKTALPNLNRLAMIPIGSSVYVPPPIPNDSSAIEICLQIGSADRRDHVLARLFAHIFREPCLDILSTREQCDYSTLNWVLWPQGRAGLQILIQSNHLPLVQDELIESLLDYVRKYLTDFMTQDDFEVYKQELITEMLADKRQLVDEANSYWYEITAQRYDFERNKLDAELLRQNIDLVDLQLFANRFIWNDAPERRKLAVHVWSDKAFDINAYTMYNEEQIIKDKNGLLSKCEFFPALSPSSQ